MKLRKVFFAAVVLLPAVAVAQGVEQGSTTDGFVIIETASSQPAASDAQKLSLRKIYEANTAGKSNFKSAAININAQQTGLVVCQFSGENQFFPVDMQGKEPSPIALEGWKFPLPIPASAQVVAARGDKVSILEPLNQMKVVGSMPHVMQAGDLMLPALSPDGKFICTRPKVDCLQFFDAKTAQPIGIPIQQTGRVLKMQFTADSKYLCSCADDKPDHFNAQNPRPIPKINTDDDGLRVWDPRIGELVVGPFGSGIDFRNFGSIATYEPIQQRVVTVKNSEFDVDALSSTVHIHSIKDRKHSLARIKIPAHSIRVHWLGTDHLVIDGGRKQNRETRRYTGSYDSRPMFIVNLKGEKPSVVNLAADTVGEAAVSADGEYVAATVKHSGGAKTTCWRVDQPEPLWDAPGFVEGIADDGWLLVGKRGYVREIRSLNDGSVVWERNGVLQSQVKRNNLWLFTAEGFEVWQAE